VGYPARATWRSGLIAPAYAHYSFQLAGPAEGSLAIDGLTVLNAAASGKSTGDVILARGPHEVELTGTLNGRSDQVRLTWSAGGSAPVDIARKYLWSGPAGGLLGEVQLSSGGTPSGPVLQRRVEGFLGFRHSTEALADSQPLTASWAGELAITSPGNYGFEVFSNGPCQVLIDDQVIVNNSQAAEEGATAAGIANLAAGAHSFKVLYNWSSGTGYLELFWTPPGGQKMLAGPEAFRAAPGAWRVGSVAEPPEYKLPLGETALPLGSGP
jgi:hypothetical protein